MTTPRAQGARTARQAENSDLRAVQRLKDAQCAAIAPGAHNRASVQIHALPRQTEAAFQTEIIKFARRLGFTVWHDAATNAPRRCGNCGQIRHLPRNPSGMPDLILVKRPRIIWVELKAEDGVVSDAQADWIEELLACGQEAYVWRPSDAQRIAEVLTR